MAASTDTVPAGASTAKPRLQQRYEDEIREKKLDVKAKLARRTDESRPLVAALFTWLTEELVGSALLPSNPFTEAARHALKRRAPLEVFLSDPAVPIDTNHLERALRPIPVGGGPGYSAGLRSGRRRSGSSRA